MTSRLPRRLICTAILTGFALVRTKGNYCLDLGASNEVKHIWPLVYLANINTEGLIL